jgi:hypothetical protein
MVKTRLAPLASLLTLAFFGFGGLAIADDGPTPPSSSTPPTTPTPPTRKPVYIIVGDVIGEVVSVNSESIKLKVTWTTVTGPNSAPPVSHWNQGSRPRTAKQLYEHQVRMQQALARHMAYVNAHTKVRVHQSEYHFDFAADAQARIKQLPPKVDENGKRVAYTPVESQKLKGNSEIPGWKADISELKVGQLVEAHVVQLQTPDKEKKDVLMVRWALILNDTQEEAAKKKNK